MIDNDRLARSYRNNTCIGMFNTIIHYRFLYEKKQKITITVSSPYGEDTHIVIALRRL